MENNFVESTFYVSFEKTLFYREIYRPRVENRIKPKTQHFSFLFSLKIYDFIRKRKTNNNFDTRVYRIKHTQHVDLFSISVRIENIEKPKYKP